MQTESGSPKFQVGQVWHYHTRPQEPESTFTIVKIDSHPERESIIHISVSGLKYRNRHIIGGFSSTIGHMPFKEDAISRSVTELASENAPLPKFEAGYKLWKQAFDSGEGGFYILTVAEAIDIMEPVLNQPRRQS
jgi:hypothetical protein